MPELGTKHECIGCGAKFYDLGKPEPICPKCGLSQLEEEEPEPAAEPAPAKKKAKKTAKPEKQAGEDEAGKKE